MQPKAPFPFLGVDRNASHMARELNHSHGLIQSLTPGRTDRIPMKVKPSSYVIPADVVSGVGQGNTLAGASLFHQALPPAFPAGLAAKQKFHSNMPHPVSGLASGGIAESKDDEVPVVTAGGEYLVAPEQIQALGGGDINLGHEYLDHMVEHVRAQVIDHMQNLPGPAQ